MAGTNVRYGSVNLVNALTRKWDEEFVLDASGTTLIGIKYHLEFQAIWTSQGTTASRHLGVTNSVGFPAPGRVVTDFKTLENDLRQPRQDLTVTHDGKTLLYVASTTTTSGAQQADRDVNLGPRCTGISIQQITPNAIRVTVGFEAMKMVCEQFPPPVSSHRWSVQETMDDNFFTERTISGRMTFTTPLTAGHAYKPLALFPLEKGFRRARIDYTAQEDGLAASYTITDKQVDTAAPWPATKINGTHRESTGHGTTFYSDVNIHLEGAPSTHRRDLFELAIRVADDRTGFMKAKAGNKLVLLEASFTDHIGDVPAVDVSIRFQRLVEGSPQLLAITKTMGTPLGENIPLGGLTYQPDVNLAPSAYGYDKSGFRDPTFLFLRHCAFLTETPCDMKDAYSPGTVESPEKSKKKTNSTGEKSESSTEETRQIVAELPPERNVYAVDDRPAMYTVYRVENRYPLMASRVQLPIAYTTGSSSDDTCLLATLAKPQARRSIAVEAKRVGAWPELPQPVDSYNDNGLQGALLFHEVAPLSPEPGVDGTQLVYTITATYVYALNRPPRAGEQISVGALPFTKLSGSDARLPSSAVYTL